MSACGMLLLGCLTTAQLFPAAWRHGPWSKWSRIKLASFWEPVSDCRGLPAGQRRSGGRSREQLPSSAGPSTVQPAAHLPQPRPGELPRFIINVVLKGNSNVIHIRLHRKINIHLRICRISEYICALHAYNRKFAFNLLNCTSRLARRHCSLLKKTALIIHCMHFYSPNLVVSLEIFLPENVSFHYLAKDCDCVELNATEFSLFVRNSYPLHLEAKTLRGTASQRAPKRNLVRLFSH